VKPITPADISDPRDRARGIRDKIAASKRKGLWVGGMAPLGYDTKDRKISINDAEAERVRTVFRSYLRLGSLNRLMADLRDQGIVTKVRTLKTGVRVCY
jgi:site-specific DNA recombinase